MLTESFESLESGSALVEAQAAGLESFILWPAERYGAIKQYEDAAAT